MEGLARSGHAKSEAAKRIPVAMDMTVCKQCCPEGVVLAHSGLQRATVHQLFQQRAESITLNRLSKPIDLVLEAWGVPTGHHPHQLYPAEFCACKSTEVILNIGIGVESRNTAKAKPQKHTALHFQPDDGGGDSDPAET